MSGGFFDYPHTKDIQQFLEDDSDLVELCEFCEQEGYYNIAKQTRAFLGKIREIREQLALIDSELGDCFNDTYSLRYAWKTCDYYNDMCEKDRFVADEKQDKHTMFKD